MTTLHQMMLALIVGSGLVLGGCAHCDGHKSTSTTENHKCKGTEIAVEKASVTTTVPADKPCGCGKSKSHK